jgi:diacylglycerol kinase
MSDQVENSDRETRSAASEFSVAARARSFGHAFAGIALLARSQHNAWIHSVATLLVIGVGALLPLSALDWCLLIFAIALVWASEALNTAIELLADALHPEHDPMVGMAKDVAAGAVLIAAIAAAIVGLIVLGPHCLELVAAWS